ncbi:MAG: hypothetical protein ACR2O6_00360, partial [Ilumatobacteraceae bacterium]
MASRPVRAMLSLGSCVLAAFAAACDDESGGSTVPDHDGPVLLTVREDDRDVLEANLELVTSRHGDCIVVASISQPEIVHPAVWPYGTVFDEASESFVLVDGTTIGRGVPFGGSGGFLSNGTA